MEMEFPVVVEPDETGGLMVYCLTPKGCVEDLRKSQPMRTVNVDV